MSKEYTSVEHAIRNIVEGSKKSRIPDADTLGTKAAEKIYDLFGMEVPTSKGELVPVKSKTDLAEPEVKTDTKVKTDLAEPEVKTDTKVRTDLAEPEVKTDTKVRTDTDTKVKTDTDTKVRTDTQTVPRVRTDTDTKVRTKDGKPPKGRSDTPKRRFKMPHLGAGATPGQSLALSGGGITNVGIYLHRADERRADLGEETKRTEIENVARPNTERAKVMSRNESIKKQIDETAKRKATIKKVLNDTVNLKPKTNDEPNEVNEGWKSKLAGALGLGLGATQGSNIENKMQKAGIQNPESQRTWFDTGLDVASMVPVVGAIPSAVSAYRSFKRGDYLDAALDALGAIPGAAVLTKGLKFGGKAAKGAGLASKLTGFGDTAQRVGGKTLVNPVISSTSKTGKAINKVSDAADAVATPGNLFQLGQASEPIVKPIAGAVKDVAVHKYNQSKQKNNQ